MHVILAGNVIDGLEVIGPFDDAEEAIQYGDDHVDPDWVVADLQAPQQDAEVAEEPVLQATTRTLRIVGTDAHDHKAVYLDGRLVFAHDYEVEALCHVAEHLGWTVQLQTITGDEYEQQYA